MSYTFRRGQRYRMPSHFGPSLGPRQGPDGRGYDCLDSPKQKIVRAVFPAKSAELENLLPPGFELREPASVTFTFCCLTEVGWLAGRGYNTFGVSIPATWRGARDLVHGELLLVLWENKADPIITGREELGFSKVYCELLEPETSGDHVLCRASWEGCEFATLSLSGLREVAPDALPPPAQPSEGLLHYKYMPSTRSPTEADAAYPTLTPAATPNLQITHASIARTASCTFRRSTWEELPTLVHIVNTLADLSLGECTEATLTRTQGAKDLSDQRALE